VSSGKQVLLRLDAGRAGGDLANPQEPADLVLQVREGWTVQPVVRSRDGRTAACHRMTVYHLVIIPIIL
jgi:hypothetical protein